MEAKDREKIAEKLNDIWFSPDRGNHDECLRAIYQAGIKEVVKWGNEPCPRNHLKLCVKANTKKRDCPLCRQAKLKEWGV